MLDDRINPLAPVSDQDRISPYNFNITSCSQVMRIKKNINRSLVDALPNSPNLHHKSCKADSNEN